MADPTTQHSAPALARLGCLIGRTYTADGEEWTVTRLLLPWSPDYPGGTRGEVFVQDQDNGGPIVPAEAVGNG